MTTNIKQLHDDTERLMQRSLGANLLFVAYLLDIARMELHQHLVPASDAALVNNQIQTGMITQSAKVPIH